MRNYDPELDVLKEKRQAAFRRKQDAFQRYQEAKEKARAAHNKMKAAWEERCSARNIMNIEYDIMMYASTRYKEIWDEYSLIRDENNSIIAALCSEADHEHAEMKRCFAEASDIYLNGEKAEAPILSAEALEHKARRDALNAEVHSRIETVRLAKEKAMQEAPKTDSSAFHEAKKVFEDAKARHGIAQDEFNRLRDERETRKAEFDEAQFEFMNLKKSFYDRLKSVRAAS